MANLKYRAWDKELQMMLDVSLIDFKKRVLIGEHWKFGETNFMNFDEIDLMQFIGLKDMNGQEIFEGDVVHAYSEGASLIGVIEYFDNAYCIKSKNGIYNSLWTNAEYFEVIGNIYENKELLKNKEKNKNGKTNI